MADRVTYRLRHKGIPVGPLTSTELLERLQSGELSLAHAIEVGGRWMTVRQHLRESTLAAPPPPVEGLAGRRLGRDEDSGIPGMPPPPGAPASPVSLEGTLRSGYLWCGLTFGLPFLILSLPYYYRGRIGLGSGLEAFLLIALAIGSTGYAFWRAWKIAEVVEGEGLADMARSLRNLAAGLGATSALFWVIATWITS